MSRRRSGRHPKVDLIGGIFSGGALARRCRRSETGALLGIRPSSRDRATASVRSAAPSLPRMWLTCFNRTAARRQTILLSIIGPDGVRPAGRLSTAALSFRGPGHSEKQAGTRPAAAAAAAAGPGGRSAR
jgi:hypothetical protein